jgi:para-nitrobenzyl esterase
MIVSTTGGKVQGLEKAGVLQFRGLPYAQASRFGPPEPAEPRDGVRDCVSFGPISPQLAGGLEAMLGGGNSPQNEQCLYLNVFTPAVDDKVRPVMVSIHGGGFTAGAGSIPWFNGSRLVRAGDLVVVTINYRLGALGFLSVEGFPGSGNNGIRDQIAALRWVKDNIAAFGGDPSNVTIFGESAGGMSVGTLLGTPSASGLFHRAIPQSGAASTVHSLDEAASVTARLMESLGVKSAEALLDVPVDRLLAAQQAVAAAGDAETSILPFRPVIDGVVVPAPPLDAVRAGAAADVPLLAGTTTDEWNLFAVMEAGRHPLDEARLLRRAARFAGDRARELVDLYRSSRPDATPSQVWAAVVTDWFFRMPAVRLASAQAGHQPHTYMYEFGYRSTAFDGALGACHAIDLPFVYDNLDAGGVAMLLGPVDEGTRALAAATSRAWLAMARTGVPAHDGLPDWPQYSSESRPVMFLDRERTVVLDPGSQERQFWDSIPG